MSFSGIILAIFTVAMSPGDSRLIPDPLSSSQPKYLTFDMCSECRHIIRLSENMIFSRDAKETVSETLHALCQRLPKYQASECDGQVKTYLPKILQQTPGHLKQEETCTAFGLCAANEDELIKLPNHATKKAISSAAQATGSSPHDVVNPACNLCLSIMKKVEKLLPKKITKDVLIKLIRDVCHLLPRTHRKHCKDFVSKHGEEIIKFLLSHVAPNTICFLLQVCLFKEQTLSEASIPSDCESCRTMAVLSRLHLGLDSNETDAYSLFQSVCVHHPNAIPECEAFIKGHGYKLQRILGKQLDGPDVCERADLCAASQTEEQGKNLCTLGPNYWCKDNETARMCGNEDFCEKYMWKD